MFNPCDLAFTRSPQPPSLREGGELVVETAPVAPPLDVPGAGTLPRPPLPGPADVVLPMANPLAAAAGNLDHMRGEPDAAAELERALPAMAQRVLDLIAKSGPALDGALSAMAGKPLEEGRYEAQGGRSGRASLGDDLAGAQRLARSRPLPPPLPPQALAPMQPVLDLVPPLEHVTIDLDKVAQLPAPSAPKALVAARAEALAIPWTSREGERLRQEAPTTVTPAQVQVALLQIPELEKFVGGALQLASDGAFKGFPAASREGFQRLAAMTQVGKPTPVGTYLVALRDVYQSYKVDFYSLLRARRALLDRRDPASLIPLLTEEELEDYLWRKYGEALRIRLWRLLRTSVREEDVPSFDEEQESVRGKEN